MAGLRSVTTSVAGTRSGVRRLFAFGRNPPRDKIETPATATGSGEHGARLATSLGLIGAKEKAAARVGVQRP